MGVTVHQLHIAFFPFMSESHMIPAADMAKIFATRDVKISIITTPQNVPIFTKTTQWAKDVGADISILTMRFPYAEAGLPEGCENTSSVTSPEMSQNLFKAADMLKEPLEQLLQEHFPNCLVADMFFPWASDVAAKFGIPRLIFHGISVFSLCCSDSVKDYEPHKKVSSDSELFSIPGLPDEIQITRMQLPEYIKNDSEFTEIFAKVKESEQTSYGVIANTYYELEPAYIDHFRKVIGRKLWHIGPISLCNRSIEDKSDRGYKASIDNQECLKWLDKKQPNSVVYVCFGTMTALLPTQVNEIAKGLEASGQDFIWVLKEDKGYEVKAEDWLPEGFEKRVEGKGLIIRGWAPQVLILEHKAVGGFVTHCGWNSSLEGIVAGVPMVTWPVFAEQFYNEKLITQILKIGVPVGARKWIIRTGDRVMSEAVEKAVTRIMIGEEAEEMRRRASALVEMAMRAVEEGGSSYSDITALIEELKLQATE